MKPIINIDELDLELSQEGNIFEEKYQSVGGLIGAKQLGYGISYVPPGKRACPFHNHHVEEEMFFILDGEGTYRYGDKSYKIRKGDFLAAPAGGRETAHHIINDSDQLLCYLSISTIANTEICEYPDSDKFAAFSSYIDENGQKQRRIRYLGRQENTLDYYDGEET